jgi:hypothetical protein
VLGKLQTRGIKKPSGQARQIRANDDGRFATFESEGQSSFHSLAEIS